MHAVQSQNGLAPLLPIEAHARCTLAIEHGPVAADGYAALLEHLGQHLVAAAFLPDVLPKQVCTGRMVVLGKHPAAGHELVEGTTRENEATAAVGEDGLLTGPDRGAEVVGGLGVERGQEALHVVPIDVRVELQEEEPVRVGAAGVCELDHGQELVLVQAPALGGLLFRSLLVLQLVVDVEVRVVVLVLGAQVGEGVDNVEGAIGGGAVGEEQQVLGAAAEASDIRRQLSGHLAGTQLQDDRHAVHCARPEGGALLPILHAVLGGERAGAHGAGPLGEDVEAALAKEEPRDEGDEREEEQQDGGAHEARGR